MGEPASDDQDKFDFHTEKVKKMSPVKANYIPDVLVDHHQGTITIEVHYKSKEALDKEAFAKKCVKALLDNIGKPGSLALSTKKAEVKSDKLSI